MTSADVLQAKTELLVDMSDDVWTCAHRREGTSSRQAHPHPSGHGATCRTQ